MKFAHLSDCHIGGWREEKMRKLSIQSFASAVDMCIGERADFVVIAGDLFNTSVPSIDAMKMVAGGMRKLHQEGIRIYVIPGSHDYSPSGKTVLEVLERSGLCAIVFSFDAGSGRLKFTVDEKTGAKLAGMVGLRGGLEKFDYLKLDRKHLEAEKGIKIFLFHSLITEFKPADFEMADSEPLMSLPKGFHYYAGGHPHFVLAKDMKNQGYGMMTYPGPLFPNNFKELEELKHGGFYMVDLDEQACNVRHIPLELKRVIPLAISAEGKSADEVTAELKKTLSDMDAADAVITVRVEGCLREGKGSDIPFVSLFARCPAYAILKNTHKLSSKEFEDFTVQQGSAAMMENALLNEQAQNFPLSLPGQRDAAALAKTLMRLLDKEKLDGERNSDFEERVIGDALKELKMEGAVDHAD